MRIAVIGGGAIGSVLAAYLSKAGEDVLLVGKKDHTDAINANGLKVTGVRGEETFRLKCATKLDEEHDLVIFVTKSQDLEHAYQANVDFLENCDVLTTQNGVQGDNILSCHFERDKMFSSIVMFGATYVKPGEVTFNFEGDWILGRPYVPVDPKTHALAEKLNKAVKTVVSDNIIAMKWLKLFVNFNNCIPAVIGKSMQETFADLDLCKLSIMLLKEGVDIIKEAHIELVSLPDFPANRIYGLVGMPIEQAAEIIHQTLPNLSKEPLYGSILQSIMRKRTSEIDFINGEIVAMAGEMQKDVPLNARIVDMVHEVEQSGKFFEIEDVKQEFNLTV